MKILGISAYYHDAAACLIYNGKILSAAQEERFTRIKHDKSFPEKAIQFCLQEYKIKKEDIDYVAFYDNWHLKKKRNLDNALTYGHLSSENFISAAYNKIKELEMLDQLKDLLNWNDDQIKKRLFYTQHHYSHAASAYYCSPFNESAVLTVDGVGEFSTTTIGYGKNQKLELLKSIDFPNSLGLFYSAFTNYLGFRVNTGEYKLMGLAPYGKPNYEKKILDHIVCLNADGSYNLNMDYFKFQYKNEMVNIEKINNYLGVAPRKENELITQEHKDLASSVQSVLEKALTNLVRYAVKETNCKNLSLAGGVALNCKALGILRNTDLIDNIFVQPAAGDAGGSMGAALALHYNKSNPSKKINHHFNVYSGPKNTDEEVENFINKRGCPFLKKKDLEICDFVAKKLAEGKTFAICRGKSEWGPRALGSRSIIANPMTKDIKRILNLKIKQREDFRPFAPIIHDRHMDSIFKNSTESPHMSYVFFLKEELRADSAILSVDDKSLSSEQLKNIKLSVIHNDWSSRVQTVNEDSNKFLSLILNNFFKITGCPILINTSFNTRGEPPVLTSKDAFRCLMRTQIDYLLLNDFILDRNKQPILSNDEIDIFDPD
jgi:carbamoyltransferase